MIYSAGPCSVCAELGDAFFVYARGSGRLFFACSECGVAWPSPPDRYVVNAIDPPEVFAPTGFSVASAEQIRAAGLEHLVKVQYPDDAAERFDGVAGFSRPEEQA